jgi:DNA-binding NtrC family response regulator
MDATSTILIVDDEVSLLNLMQTFLRKLGYKVEGFNTGAAAQGAFEADPEKFQLIIADLTLPDMSGEQLSVMLARRSPHVRVLLCSGYPFDVRSIAEDLRERFGVLQKPFLPKMLAASIDELLKRNVIP